MTAGQSVKPTSHAPAPNTKQPQTQQNDGSKTNSKTSIKTGTTQPQQTSKAKAESTSHIPTVIQRPKETNTVSSALEKATGKVSSSSHSVDSKTATASPTTIPTASSDQSSSAASHTASSSSGGTSAGAKAGIAFGVLGGLLLVGLLVYFIFSRRKKRSGQDNDDEKTPQPMMAASAGEDSFGRTNPKAPRISLRPVTQFFPNWNMDKRASKGAAMALSPTPGAGKGSRLSPNPGPWDRPSTSQSTHSANPFGYQAERVPSPVAEERSLRAQSPAPPPKENPFASNGMYAAAGAGTVVAAGAAAGAGAGLMTRKASMRQKGVRNLDLTLAGPTGTSPPSPAGTEFSETPMTPGMAPAPTNGAAAIAAAGGPANSTVHRVQLDFKATMEDEMGLRAGDLVRLLHEYDDGWVS